MTLSALVLISWAAPVRARDNPLSLDPENPHYFLFRGKPAILITSGEHYGAVLNLDFDYPPYLKELQANGLNHTRTFSGTYREVPSSFGITENTLAPQPNRYLAPWARSTTPGYFDGGNKFDLTRWDEAYFRRLRDFVAQASKAGVVIELNLFCPLYEQVLWEANPMNATNNINGTGNCPRNEVYSLVHEDLTRVQKAVVRKIVESLAGFDNVYYEICNEPWFGGVTLAWQNEIALTIREAEARAPARHLISLNCSKQKLTNSYPDISIFNFHYAAPPDVIAQNYGLRKALGNNETGFRGKDNFAYRTEAWDFILAGGALVSSLDYSFTARHPDGSFLDYHSPGGGNPTFRGQLKILKDFIHGCDFVHMKPDDSLIAAGIPSGLLSARVLAEPGAYALYLRTRTDADRFSVRWTGTVTATNDETWTFYIASTDGVRLWINDQLLIDNPRRHEKIEDYCHVDLRTGQKATLRLEYSQARRGSAAKLMWSGSSHSKLVIPAERLRPPDGVGEGLKGEYYEDRTMKKVIMTRMDRAIDFDWTKADPFSAQKLDMPVALTLQLPAGNYRAEWIDPKTGRSTKRELFEHAGGGRSLTSPIFTEDAALKLTHQKQQRPGRGSR